MARNLLINQSKPAGRSFCPVPASELLVPPQGRDQRTNNQCEWSFVFRRCGPRFAHERSRMTCRLLFPIFTHRPKNGCPHVPTLGHGIARTRGRFPCPALLFCTSVLHSFRCIPPRVGNRFPPRFTRLHPRQLAHFYLPQNFCISLRHPYEIRPSPVYSMGVPLIGRGRIHRRVCPIIPNS